jgi:GTPase Era involved in 16S rRNA processing
LTNREVLLSLINGHHNRPTVSVKPTRSVSLAERSTSTTRSGDVGKVLQMIQTIDYDKPQRVGLMAVAAQVGSLSTLTAQDWQELWKNEIFCKFIDHCVERRIAVQQISVIVENNEENKQSIPPTLLRKLYLVTLPLKFDSTEEFQLACESIIQRDAVPEDFMKVLTLSCKRNEMFCRTLSDANALIHWNPASNTFTRGWDVQTIRTVYGNLAEYLSKLYSVTLPPKFHGTAEFQLVCESIVKKGTVPVDFMKVLTLSCQRNEMFAATLKDANALFHWNPHNRTFTREWDVQVVHTAIKRLAELQRKPYEVTLPAKFNSIEIFQSVCGRIIESGVMPDNFMKVLTLSCERSEAFLRNLRDANALIHWNSDSNTFTTDWDVQTVRMACESIAVYQTKFHLVSLPSKYDNIQHFHSVCARIVESGVMPDGFMKVLTFSCERNEEFYRALKDANALIYWDSENNIFTREWDAQTVRITLQNVARFISREEDADRKLKFTDLRSQGGFKEAPNQSESLSDAFTELVKGRVEVLNFHTEAAERKPDIVIFHGHTSVNESQDFTGQPQVDLASVSVDGLKFSFQNQSVDESVFERDIAFDDSIEVPVPTSLSERHEMLQRISDGDNAVHSSPEDVVCTTEWNVRDVHTAGNDNAEHSNFRTEVLIQKPTFKTLEEQTSMKGDRKLVKSSRSFTSQVDDIRLNFRKKTNEQQSASAYNQQQNYLDEVSQPPELPSSPDASSNGCGDGVALNSTDSREYIAISSSQNVTESANLHAVHLPGKLSMTAEEVQRDSADAVQPSNNAESSTITDGAQTGGENVIKISGDVDFSAFQEVAQRVKVGVMEPSGDFPAVKDLAHLVRVDIDERSGEVSTITDGTQHLIVDATKQPNDFSVDVKLSSVENGIQQTTTETIDALDDLSSTTIQDTVQFVKVDVVEPPGNFRTIEYENQRLTVNLLEPSCGPDYSTVKEVIESVGFDTVDPPVVDLSTIKNETQLLTAAVVDPPSDLVVKQHKRNHSREIRGDVFTMDGEVQGPKTDVTESPYDADPWMTRAMNQRLRADIIGPPGEYLTMSGGTQRLIKDVIEQPGNFSTVKTVTQHVTVDVTEPSVDVKVSSVENGARREGVETVNASDDVKVTSVGDITRHAKVDFVMRPDNPPTTRYEALRLHPGVDIVEPSCDSDFSTANVVTEPASFDNVEPPVVEFSTIENGAQRSRQAAINKPVNHDYSEIQDVAQHVNIEVTEPFGGFTTIENEARLPRTDIAEPLCDLDKIVPQCMRVDPPADETVSSIEDATKHKRALFVDPPGGFGFSMIQEVTKCTEVGVSDPQDDFSITSDMAQHVRVDVFEPSVDVKSSSIDEGDHYLRIDTVDSRGDAELSAIRNTTPHVKIDIVEPKDELSTVKVESHRLPMDTVDLSADLEYSEIQDVAQHVSAKVTEPLGNFSTIETEAQLLRTGLIEAKVVTQGVRVDVVEPSVDIEFSTIGDEAEYLRIDTVDSLSDAKSSSIRNTTPHVKIDIVESKSEFSTVKIESHRPRVDTVDPTDDLDPPMVQDVTPRIRPDVTEPPGDFSTINYEPQHLSANVVEPPDNLYFSTIEDVTHHMKVDIVQSADDSSTNSDGGSRMRVAIVEPPSELDFPTTHEHAQDVSLEVVEPPVNFEFSKVNQTMPPKPNSSDVRRILLGNARFNIGQKDYYTVSELLPVPKVESHNNKVTTFVAKVLPYLLQRMKMRGCRVLQATRIARLVTSGDCNENDESNSDASPVSRLDCITCLMNVVSPAVASDLLSVMAQFPTSLPLLVTSLENSSRIDLTPWLCGITVKWECGRIIENSLFIDPFRLLVAFRLGKNEYGKSTILNQLFATDNVFSSKGEDGAVFGEPACLHGSAEFVFLTRETCKDTLWENSVKHFYAHGQNEIILLANVHGDITDQLDTIAVLNRFSCSYLAFVMPDCDESALSDFTRAVGSDNRVTTIRVDPKDYDPHADIKIVQLVSNETIKKVCKAVEKALQLCEVVHHFDHHTLQVPDITNVKIVQSVSTPQSAEIVNLVRQKSCKTTKQSLHLKQLNDNNEQSPTTLNSELDEVVRLFIDVFKLPTDELNMAVIHLEKELSRLSNAESARARSEVAKLKSSLQNAGTVNPDPNEAARLQAEIRIALEKIDHMNLGFEHLLRKTAQLYTSVVQETRSSSSGGGGAVYRLPQTVAQLIVDGHAVELLDGDAGYIPMAWFLAVCKNISQLRPNLRVYVVSILGLQSSGKSTLLNSLFACRFAVSVGRCSRGLFMRLLIVDEKISKDYDFDAILLIDSEGLGSTEKINDPEAVKKDRLLATFAMSISSMTIINVLGDTAKDLAEILQIAIVTMARLKKADISPDVTMVQHLLTEKNEEKTLKMEEEVCRAIQNAIELAEKKDVQVGALNTKCWQTLLRRIQDKTLLLHFHPFKDGATVNSPPSELYHEDVIRLYNKILTSCKESKAAVDFRKWYSLVESFWEFVSADDFALHFKNTKEIYEFIDRGQRIARVKEAFGEAFSHHAKQLKEEILVRSRDDSSNAARSRMEEEIEIELDSIPNCQWNCEKCQAVRELQLMLSEFVRDQPHEEETLTTIRNHQERLLEANLKRLVQTFDAAVVQYGCCAEFDDTITTYLHAYFEQKKPGEFGDDDKASIVKTIFAELRNAELRKLADNGVADDDDTVLQKFINELRVVYPQAQQVVPLFQAQQLLQFEDIIQYRQDDTEAEVLGNGTKTGFSWDEKHKETNELKTCLADLPKAVIKQMSAECFEIGMVELMYTKVTEVLERFRFLHLSPETNMNLHAWAQKLLFSEVEALQFDWDRQNKPLAILEQNEERYEQMIYTRLEYGFTVESEGLIIAKSLAAAISSKTVAAVAYIKTLTMKSLTWAKNSEKIRLEYFKGLAEEISAGNKQRALQHFKNPRETIEQWYEERVRDHYSASDVPVLYQKGYRVELQHVLNAVAGASSWPELLSEVTSYTTRDNAVGYKPSNNFGDDAAIDLEHIKRTIVDELNCDGGDAPPDSLFQLVLPPRDSDVMLRLGCTASCGFCGALCWGEREHDMNADDSKRHHSSHQPRGLILTGYRDTDCLVARPCHELTDDLRVWFGDFKETGMTWGEAKRNHFADWKFDRHTVREFDELMRWFFQELHVDIAASVDNRKPATDEDLRKYQCKGLQLPAIIHRMEHEIK